MLVICLLSLVYVSDLFVKFTCMLVICFLNLPVCLLSVCQVDLYISYMFVRLGVC